jgi:hypothetical protein
MAQRPGETMQNLVERRIVTCTAGCITSQQSQ